MVSGIDGFVSFMESVINSGLQSETGVKWEGCLVPDYSRVVLECISIGGRKCAGYRFYWRSVVWSIVEA